MSGYAHRLLSAMKPGQVYTTDELVVMTNLPRDEVHRVCELLVHGGMLDDHGTERVSRKKQRKVSSKQQRLF